MDEDTTGPDARAWEIRVGLYTTEERARELVDAIRRTLCPDPDHAPPCPVPWQTALVEADDDYPGLREQYEIERVPRAPSRPEPPPV
jgi:hypothetical protein